MPMDASDIISHFQLLSGEQQTKLLWRLELINMEKEVSNASIMEEIQSSTPINCPHCKGISIVSNGKQHGVRRYRCKGCGKNYSEATGTTIAWLKKKKKFKQYVNHMLAGHSIRKCAELTGVSNQTSFDWRHKILSSMSLAQAEQLRGICESDDMFFDYSEKGKKKLGRSSRKRGGELHRRGISDEKVAVIISCDRQGSKDLHVATRGRIRKKDIARILENKIKPGSVLCTDSHRSYTAFARSAKIQHKKIKANKGQYVKNKIYHVQHVNQTGQALRKWMGKFNGVSTKYLQNYLNWYAGLEKVKNDKKQLHSFAKLAFASPSAWFEHKNISQII